MTAMRRAPVLFLVVAYGCGAAPSSEVASAEALGAGVATPEPATVEPATVEPATVQPTPVEQTSVEPATVPPESPPLLSAEMRGTAAACAVMSISFDRRALPTDTSGAGFENWVLGEADDIRRAAPRGTSPRMYTAPDGGTVHALFDGSDAPSALAQCEATLAAYLPTAPNLPLIGFGSAAHVTMACRSCD